MTPSERERRIERAAAAISGQFEGGYRGHWCAEWQKDLHCERCMEIASAALAAADEAAPVVSEAEMQRRSRIDHEAAERAEAEGSQLRAAIWGSLQLMPDRPAQAERLLRSALPDSYLPVGARSMASTPRPASTERNQGER